MLIENFNSGESDSSGDVKFTIELKEYIEVTPELKEDKSKESAGAKFVPTDNSNKTVYKDYVIKKGDTLWDIAKTFYKDATRWPEIYERNKKVIGSNPHYILPGQVIKV